MANPMVSQALMGLNITVKCTTTDAMRLKKPTLTCGKMKQAKFNSELLWDYLFQSGRPRKVDRQI